MIKAKIEAIKAIRVWCKKEKIRLISKPRHVHHAAYVMGRAAPLCLIVAEPWMNSEPQTKRFDLDYPLSIIHKFDDKLSPGDWCITGYICMTGMQEKIAIRIPV